jgi:hypothetical protein
MRRPANPHLSLFVIGLLACGGDNSGPVNEPLSVEIAGGDEQVVRVGEPAPLPLAVRVETGDGEVASVELTAGDQAGPLK